MDSPKTRPDETLCSDRAEYKPLEEYGIIGNLETVALVGRDGAIDWCCFPHVEDTSIFARILDSEQGGHWTIAPARSYEARQEYVDRTNVLQTRFKTEAGEATVTDFMPIPEQTVSESHSAIYRRVTGIDGKVGLVSEFEPRFDYARCVPTMDTTGDGVRASGEDEIATLATSLPQEVEPGTSHASFTVEEGETRWFVLSYDQEIQHQPAAHEEQLKMVTDYWQNWTHTCAERSCPVDGPWHDLAVRSGLLLKLLIHRETGAICAAPTTSLPEEVGGVRNWDYRYNWIRDATLTVQALTGLGHLEEAREYFSLCLSHCSRGTPAEMQPLYGLHGETDLDEWTLDHLSGYCDSKPVRVGNKAASQRQLDIYGELVVGVYETIQHGESLSPEHWTFVQEILDYVCSAWEKPDVGIWEIRGEPEHFVYSKVMCWAALDRGIKLVEETEFDGPTERWRDAREEIHETVLQRGYSDELDSFVRSFEKDEQLDAALLRIPAVGFLPADDPRMQGTIDAILDRLATSDRLVDRLEGDDGLPGEEGSFVVCSFWLINALALAGRTEEAMESFENVCQFVSPLGLLAEEIDGETGRQVGNLPQAFSLIGLINSIIHLMAQRDEDEDGDSFEDYERPSTPLDAPAVTAYPGYRETSDHQ